MLDAFSFKVLFVSSYTLLLAFISQSFADWEGDVDHKWESKYRLNEWLVTHTSGEVIWTGLEYDTVVAFCFNGIGT